MKLLPMKRLPNSKECATLSATKGQVFKNSYTVTHQKTNKDIDIYVLASELPTIELARAAVSELTGLDHSAVKYSYPAIARQVSEWLGGDPCSPSLLRNELIPVWHYQHCVPCRVAGQTIYDMRAAYWQIACMSPTLNIEVLPEKERVIFLPMSRQQETKWNSAKVTLNSHKKLRLALIGVNCATQKSKLPRTANYFARGEPRILPGKPPTWFQRLSLLTVRVAYELTQMQAMESETLYANADCVAVDDGQIPQYWSDYGIQYSSKGTGTLHALAVGMWKCGREYTLTYDYATSHGYNVISAKSAFRYPRPVYHEHYAALC